MEQQHRLVVLARRPPGSGRRNRLYTYKKVIFVRSTTGGPAMHHPLWYLLIFRTKGRCVRMKTRAVLELAAAWGISMWKHWRWIIDCGTRDGPPQEVKISATLPPSIPEQARPDECRQQNDFWLFRYYGFRHVFINWWRIRWTVGVTGNFPLWPVIRDLLLKLMRFWWRLPNLWLRQTQWWQIETNSNEVKLNWPKWRMPDNKPGPTFLFVCCCQQHLDPM